MISNEPDVRAAIVESRQERIENRLSRQETTYGPFDPVLNMAK